MNAADPVRPNQSIGTVSLNFNDAVSISPFPRWLGVKSSVPPLIPAEEDGLTTCGTPPTPHDAAVEAELTCGCWYGHGEAGAELDATHHSVLRCARDDRVVA